MIPHPHQPLEHFSAEQVEAVLQAAFTILAETGLVVQCAEAVQALQAAGCPLTEERVRFPNSLCQETLAQAPSQFTLYARDPRYSLTVGADQLLLSPGYGSAFVADAEGTRREATLEDFRRFAVLAGASELVDITGGLLVEPADVPPEQRPEVLTRTLLECSPKPFL
ncbi:MAG: trimethylamine methyltransferase family protein, partial [Armatimonadetes bacterium]|nr:trimethylamine methyltransferase family protein [Armatimonadota bacterium]